MQFNLRKFIFSLEFQANTNWNCKIDKSNGKKIQSGLDVLFNKIFVEDEYSNMVRPYGVDELTAISTELKLLQIDLVKKNFNFKLQSCSHLMLS